MRYNVQARHQLLRPGSLYAFRRDERRLRQFSSNANLNINDKIVGSAIEAVRDNLGTSPICSAKQEAKARSC